MKQDERVSVLGVSISNLDRDQLNEKIFLAVEQNRKEMVLNVNVHAMNIASKLDWFKEMLNSAYINFCDGDGVRIGAKLLGINIVEKITYNRWIWEFAELCESNNVSWYLVGSHQSTIEKAVKNLKTKFPSLNIAGFHNGFLNNFSKTERLIKDIADKQPHILILGMGMPYQESWLKEHSNELNYNVVLTGGAVFEYISGNAKMTPNIYYKLKLEWLYRFFQEPKRLFKRYFFGNIEFIMKILK